jgi:predicted metal-dependent enzyme (double-stranded beta helix superfamily)
MTDLRAIVDGLADDPERWRHLISHDPDQRVYEELLRDEHVSVWLICWMEDQDTGFHDHDISSGAVHVVSGQVREERLAVGGEPAGRVVGAGESFAFNAFDIHRVLHAGAEPAVTIHAYSPPLWRMGAYLVEPDGTLQRHSVSYAEELRPLESEVPVVREATAQTA